ncbi:hypothetical protein JCM3775_005616 [Rhodotorula graminis]|uniref:Uncharacterized protein n=1 Tax=Rhodotorula graminis (strain WP1) TaxID=578459 RepID=A0A194SAR0_RHOGW|nr:uncharacterized protein RHOBADRAFT_51515 [Rhodotorula graminis WP1]KPV77697.1 hypothetical protein RHOBADRAFT_51515 [Rhodotorula graminis WP1]
MLSSSFHSDSGSDNAASHSDDSASTLARSSPFDPLRRPAPRSSAALTYLSPGRKRLQRKQYLPPSTPKPQESYSHTPWAPERPVAGEPVDNTGAVYHAPTYSNQHHGDLDPFSRSGILVHPSKVLHRPLNDQWAIVAKTTPAVNKAAEREAIHLRGLEVVDWAELRSHDNPLEFLKLLFKKDGRGDNFAHTPRKKAGGSSASERFNQAHEHLKKDNAVTRRAQERVAQNASELTLEKLSLSDRDLRPIDYFPQIERFLTNEANASEAFISNALNGVVAVAEQFLPSDYLSTHVHEDAPVGPGLKIICSGQHALEKHADDSGNASALDLTFALVSWPPTQKPKFRFDLVIVEMKRPGYVVHEHWTGVNFRHVHDEREGDKVHLFPKMLLPQVMLYNRRSGCERFVFSDYLASVAVHVDHESMVDPAKAKVLVGAQPITFERGSPVSPYKGSVGTAIAFEVAQALKALGCANPDLFRSVYSDKDGQEHEIPLHESIETFLRTHGKV